MSNHRSINESNTTNLLLSSINVSVYENLVQDSLNDILYKYTVISADGFNAFAIHLVVFLSVGPE